MRKFEELIRFENANSAVAFRERAYDPRELACFLRDVVAMANAPVKGPRFIFLGVRDDSRGRQIKGVSQQDLIRAGPAYQELVATYVEPALEVNLRQATVDELCVGVLTISGCDDPPYLINRNLSRAIRQGAGWIRRGDAQSRLTRADLQRIFEEKLLGVHAGWDIEVSFGGDVLQRQEIVLTALPLDRRPSRLARERIREMLEAHDMAKDMLGRTDTRIERLLHARLFGGEVPYCKRSADSLVSQLDEVAQNHEAADRYYECEQRAHKLNLCLRNRGERPMEHAALAVEIPRLEGVGVAECIETPPGARPPPEGYPRVEPGPRMFRAEVSIGRLQPGSAVQAFRQPLRLLLREAAAGRTLPVYYRLHAKDLDTPIEGSLRIHVASGTAERESA